MNEEPVAPGRLRYTDRMLTRPSTGGIDAVSGLEHFAIVTYAIPPERLRPLVHPRYDLDLLEIGGELRALISVVPFIDRDFHFTRLPFPRWRFGQTNYRAYVMDRETGEHLVWFFGTTLDSWTVGIPRYVWRLPWHRARMRFNCEYDEDAKRYLRYELRAKSNWAPLGLELEDSGEPVDHLDGFESLESGEVLLTHTRFTGHSIGVTKSSADTQSGMTACT
jgi:hypothetical protein